MKQQVCGWLGEKAGYWTRNICMQLSTSNIYQHVIYSFIFNTRLYVICGPFTWKLHYCDVIMSAMASQITGFPIVCSTVCSGADQRKPRSSASLTFVRGIHTAHVFIWWRHHVDKPIGKSLSIATYHWYSTTVWNPFLRYVNIQLTNLIEVDENCKYTIVQEWLHEVC